MRKSKSKPASTPGKTKKILLKLLVCIALIIVFRIGVMFIFVGMLPTMVVHYIDKSPSRSNFHTVFACNLAGILPFLARLIAINGSSEVSLVMQQPLNWLIVYGAAAIGWILVYIGPFCAQFLINGMHERQIASLKRSQKRLIQEWGQEVAGKQEPNNTQ